MERKKERERMRECAGGTATQTSVAVATEEGTETGEGAVAKVYKLRLFGWHIAISRRRLKARPSQKGRSKKRTGVKRARLEMAGGRCEICGIPVDMRCALHHRLPKGAEGRNEVGNVLVTCSDCHHRLQGEPHLLALTALEDGTRYDPDQAYLDYDDIDDIDDNDDDNDGEGEEL